MAGKGKAAARGGKKVLKGASKVQDAKLMLMVRVP